MQRGKYFNVTTSQYNSWSQLMHRQNDSPIKMKRTDMRLGKRKINTLYLVLIHIHIPTWKHACFQWHEWQTAWEITMPTRLLFARTQSQPPASGDGIEFITPSPHHLYPTPPLFQGHPSHPTPSSEPWKWQKTLVYPAFINSSL